MNDYITLRAKYMREVKWEMSKADSRVSSLLSAKKVLKGDKMKSARASLEKEIKMYEFMRKELAEFYAKLEEAYQ
jgi:hypothetical protein